MKNVIGRNIGVIDENGIIIASSEPNKIGESRQRVKEDLLYSSDMVVFDGYTYHFVTASGKNEGIIAYVEGDDAHASKMVEILAISLGNIKSLYDEKHDRVSFIKNVLLDNILPGDIYIKSNELHFSDEPRAVIVIKFLGMSSSAPYEFIQNSVIDKNKDFAIGIGEQDIIIVKEVGDGATAEDLENYARTIFTRAEKELSAKVLIGISSVVVSLKDLSRAYKEARIALEVGKVFDIERPVMCYENLGIGRLIYQLPTTLCDIFLGEVFKKGSLESLDRETLMTVQSFFENNLNVSETSRKLFVHRNTLVYRLEKIRKITGLDLREFDHAVTFKVALMVKKYLTSKPTKF